MCSLQTYSETFMKETFPVTVLTNTDDVRCTSIIGAFCGGPAEFIFTWSSAGFRNNMVRCGERGRGIDGVGSALPLSILHFPL